MNTEGSQTYVAQALKMSGVDSRFLPPGEQLVGVGFRYWLHGYHSGKTACWQRCCDHFSSELGCSACAAIAGLADWVNAIRSTGLRRIELLPENCRSFCRDECLAVTLVAASEHHDCPALQVCAYTLLGGQNIEPALTAARRFADTLRGCGVSFVGGEPGRSADRAVH